MAKPIELVNTNTNNLAGMNAEDLLTLLASRLGNAPAAAQPMFPQELLDFIAADLKEKAQRKAQEKKEAEAMARQNAENARMAALVTETEQSECRHQKPNNDTALAGQPLSNGGEVLICLKCQKTWLSGVDDKGNSLPHHLIPDNIRRGIPGGF